MPTTSPDQIAARYERIALVDEVEQRSDDERDDQGASGDAFRDGEPEDRWVRVGGHRGRLLKALQSVSRFRKRASEIGRRDVASSELGDEPRLQTLEAFGV